MYDKFYDVVLPQPEIWKGIEDFEKFYEVSNYGRVKSLDRITDWWCGREGKTKSSHFKGRVLKPKCRDGYSEVRLQYKGKDKHITVHRLVAQAFIKCTKDYPSIDHKNDDKSYNTVWNLKPCTVSYNTKKAVDSGKLTTHNTKITESTKQFVRELLEEGLSMRQIARDYEISRRSVARIKNGEI